jgi:UDP-glucose 6-dehydrogenase
MILLCGYGNIGKKLYPEFKELAKATKNSISVYDPGIEYIPGEEDIVPNRVLDFTGVHYDIAFICVPTNKLPDGSCDTSIVLNLINAINADVIVIKSTISIDIIDKLPTNVVYSPEFTGCTQHVGKHDYVILGGDRKYCNIVASAYKKLKDGSFIIKFTDYKTAILTKYMENCFLGLKVTFCNEMASAAKQLGVEYDDVRELFLLDPRMNPSHTIVYEDQPYYDSHCLNKDIPAFNAMFNLPLMKAVESINKKLKEDWRHK